MTEPAPIEPPFLTESVQRRLRGVQPVQPAEQRETPDEAAERALAAFEVRRRLWRVPPQFADASESALTRDQDPKGRIRAWLGSEARNLIIWSTTTGNGKSYAAHAIGNAAIEAGVVCATWPLTRLNQAFRPGGDETAYDVACAVELLVLDEVGGETVSEWTLDRLRDVLDARATKRTIFTTNLPGEAMARRYDDRIIDRMIDGAWIVEFTGDTFRKPAPW